jgi:16S rRNA (guanine966-N2)-methyltransferase
MRVIAGRFRGRPLRSPRGHGTRPTTDRVREALFSILGDVTGAHVADLYAGSGALGIEALSRGAAHVVFIEASRVAAAVLRDNLDRLGLSDSGTLLSLPVERARAVLDRNAPYDLVFCDPPWPQLEHALRTLGRLLLGPNLLADSGRVLLEHPSAVEPGRAFEPGLVAVDQRSWGDTAITFFSKPYPRT